jgi:hypothetical protein
MRRQQKPIRVFFSELSHRFYATRAWQERTRNGKRYVVVTGEKFDVTNDIADLIATHGISFREKKKSS